ncbi:hypothetical protein JCM10449v2_000102 [Rhodotorula kratochvilovae]
MLIVRDLNKFAHSATARVQRFRASSFLTSTAHTLFDTLSGATMHDRLASGDSTPQRYDRPIPSSRFGKSKVISPTLSIIVPTVSIEVPRTMPLKSPASCPGLGFSSGSSSGSASSRSSVATLLSVTTLASLSPPSPQKRAFEPPTVTSRVGRIRVNALLYWLKQACECGRLRTAEDLDKATQYGYELIMGDEALELCLEQEGRERSPTQRYAFVPRAPSPEDEHFEDDDHPAWHELVDAMEEHHTRVGPPPVPAAKLARACLRRDLRSYKSLAGGLSDLAHAQRDRARFPRKGVGAQRTMYARCEAEEFLSDDGGSDDEVDEVASADEPSTPRSEDAFWPYREIRVW